MRRFAAEAAAMKRAYCNMFRFWLACPVKRCRKTRNCLGDQDTCLKRGLKDVPRRVQFQARQQLIAATPASAGPPEHAARESMPLGLFELAAQNDLSRRDSIKQSLKRRTPHARRPASQE